MYQALYRKWRPQTFDDVCGQEHITSILKYETEHNKFSHAYLFCGSRGTGKTTCAKILAKAVNCESPVNGSPCNCCPSCQAIDAGIATDVLEMDAASNNGVDNIRDIRDEVVYSPSSLKYRVYIVDEVHMLSGSAFNALLKTLEEPPSHVIFILATTELHKLPSTIVSRCQRYEFRRISTDVLVGRLATIAQREEIAYEADALRMIAKLAQGGMRDAISLLELCAGGRQKITAQVVNDTLGTGGREQIEQTVRAIEAGNFDAIFGTVDAVVRSSKDLSVFWQDLSAFYRDMLVIKTTSAAANYLDLTEVETEHLQKVAALFTKEELLYHCRVLEETYATMQRAGAAKRTIAEMALIRLCDRTLDHSPDAILARLSKLETTVLTGGYRVKAGINESILSDAEKAEADKLIKEENNAEIGLAASPLLTEQDAEVTFRVLRGWNEVAEQATAGDGAPLAFLKMAKALVGSDGKIYIRFANEFAQGMIERANLYDKIRACLCLHLKRELAEKDVIFGLIAGDEDSLSDLDELMI